MEIKSQALVDVVEDVKLLSNGDETSKMTQVHFLAPTQSTPPFLTFRFIFTLFIGEQPKCVEHYYQS